MSAIVLPLPVPIYSKINKVILNIYNMVEHGQKQPVKYPHITLQGGVYKLAELDRAIASFSDQETAVPIEFDGLGGFSKNHICIKVKKTETLLCFHKRAYQFFKPFIAKREYLHCRPGEWFPHVTLASKYINRRNYHKVIHYLNGLRNWNRKFEADNIAFIQSQSDLVEAGLVYKHTFKK
jgi:2'-5' RNA ligase